MRAACVITLLAAMAASAQFGRPAKEMVRVAAGETVQARPGQTIEVPVTFEVLRGFHVNADKPTIEYLIPTKLQWESKDWKLTGITYPASQKKSFSFAPEKPLDVYEGTLQIKSKFVVPRTAAAGKTKLKGSLRYQACDDSACYPPATLAVEVPVEIGAAGRSAASPAKPSPQKGSERRPARSAPPATR
jgi:hypothetical protein